MKLTRNRMRRDERTFDVAVEHRADDDKPLRIVGHPIVYDRWSVDLGGFRERVRPGAATKALLEDDIRALLNHDPNYVLGRNRAGTLMLTDQAGSLRMELYPADTPTVRDMVVTPMERGDLTQMSFAFRTIRDDWREPKAEGGLWERDLLEVSLYDVSVVTYPAYSQADAAVRSALASAGIAWDVLAALLTRADRGVPLTSGDTDLVEATVAVLRSYLPSEPEPPATTPDEPQAGRSIAHLRALLELQELTLQAA